MVWGGVVLDLNVVADVVCSYGTTTIYSSMDANIKYLFTAIEKYGDGEKRASQFYIENNTITQIYPASAVSYTPTINGNIMTYYHASSAPFEVVLTQLD